MISKLFHPTARGTRITTVSVVNKQINQTKASWFDCLNRKDLLFGLFCKQFEWFETSSRAQTMQLVWILQICLFGLEEGCCLAVYSNEQAKRFISACLLTTLTTFWVSYVWKRRCPRVLTLRKSQTCLSCKYNVLLDTVVPPNPEYATLKEPPMADPRIPVPRDERLCCSLSPCM